MSDQIVAPGPGTWVLETTHFSTPMPLYSMELFPEGIARGFKEGTRKYGLPLSHVDMQPVNGFIYAHQVMVGEPDEPKDGPPPGWLFYLITRLHPEFRARNKAWLSAVKNRLWESDLVEWDTKIKPDSVKRNLTLVEQDLQAMGVDALISHLGACRENMAEMFYRHHKYSVTAILPVGMLVATATRSGVVSDSEAIALLRGSTPVSTGAFHEELAQLADTLRQAGVSRETIEALPPEQVRETLSATSEEVKAALDNYLKLAGTALVSGYSIAERTANETPNILKSRLIHAISPPVDREEGDVSAKIASVRDRLPAADQDEFDFWIQAARKINRMRDERGVYNDIWAAGISRTAILEAGSRLTAQGVLSDAELAIEASHDELVGMLKGEVTDLEDVLAARLAHRKTARIEDMPEFFGPPPDGPLPPFHLMPAGLRAATSAMMAAMGNLNDEEDAAELEANEESTLVLSGISVSPGVYDGTARVISGSEDFGRIEQGDVLITKNTSAAFNVVLPSLGALVTDRGGLLSHAAIVSREYGIPGVVATKKATREIPDGARVRVDGDNGTVSLLK